MSRRGSFTSHDLFQIETRNLPISFSVFSAVALVLPLQTLPDIETRFNLNLMSMTSEQAIKGQINLWLWKIVNENPFGYIGEGTDTDVRGVETQMCSRGVGFSSE